ncbi:hypothetical protein GQ53DRAFT_818763 [Thozetella sp. PMI_491]|nr:hypothetical protein GQ53DRAFT_818763 [Thozetella sp. PMI_491]
MAPFPLDMLARAFFSHDKQRHEFVFNVPSSGGHLTGLLYLSPHPERVTPIEALRTEEEYDGLVQLRFPLDVIYSLLCSCITKQARFSIRLTLFRTPPDQSQLNPVDFMCDTLPFSLPTPILVTILCTHGQDILQQLILAGVVNDPNKLN